MMLSTERNVPGDCGANRSAVVAMKGETISCRFLAVYGWCWGENDASLKVLDSWRRDNDQDE